MFRQALSVVKVVGVSVAVILLIGGGVGLVLLRDAWKARANEGPASSRDVRPQMKMISSQGLEVPEDVIKTLGVRTTEVQQAARPRAVLTLNGSLSYDPDQMNSIKTLFNGDVVALGQTVPSALDDTSDPLGKPRPLRYGDRVTKDQLLLVLSSKDLGEKKSELVNAYSQLWLDEDNLANLRKGNENGVIPPRQVREAERTVEGDQIAVTKAELTLRSWRLPDADLEIIKQEALRLRGTGSRSTQKHDENWARLEVKSPRDGFVLEKNVNVGSQVDPSVEMLKIGELKELCVWAYVYDDDLPALHDLPRPIRWTIRLKNDPNGKPLDGTGVVETIGRTIDQSQHTALVMGRINNLDGRLRIGQLVTATIELPARSDEVEVPTTALVEDGQNSIVFVETDAGQHRYSMRRVSVARRYHDIVCVRLQPTEGADPLRPGERVVSSGAVEFKAALEELKTNASAEQPAH